MHRFVKGFLLKTKIRSQMIKMGENTALKGLKRPKNGPNSRPEQPKFLHSMKRSDAVNFRRKSK